jgi:hypothetical protein
MNTRTLKPLTISQLAQVYMLSVSLVLLARAAALFVAGM